MSERPTLRALRIAAGVSINEVAAVLAVEPAYYSRLELGRRHLTARQVDALVWRYGWRVEARQPQAAPRQRAARRMSEVSRRSEQLGTQAELLAMMGLAVYADEVPQDWRNRWRHRRLWEQAICAASRQMRRGAK